MELYSIFSNGLYGKVILKERESIYLYMYMYN